MQGEFFMFKKKHGCPAPPQPKVLGRLIRSAELPLEILEGLPAIELRGNREAVVEHCESVVEYSQERVRLRAKSFLLEFTGRNLRLNCMTDESAVITGFITGIGLAQQGG